MPKIPAECYIPAFDYGNLLFDLEKDPGQEHSVQDREIEERLCQFMTDLMKREDAPAEQYIRMGLEDYL